MKEHEKISNTRLDLKQVWIDDLKDDDLILLDKAAKTSYYGHELKHIVEDIAHLRLQCWIGRGPRSHFALLTKLTTHPGGKELAIWCVAGKGYVRNLEGIYERLKEFAKAEGCRWLTGYVDRKGFGRLYARFAPLKKYGLWMKEL